MKKHNEKLLESTKKLSQETLCKSKETVGKLTHPSKKVSSVGSVIGSSIGVGLVIAGTTGLALGGKLLGMGSLVAGVSTITSNIINMRKKSNNRSN